jgi:hypothetical protein
MTLNAKQVFEEELNEKEFRSILSDLKEQAHRGDSTAGAALVRIGVHQDAVMVEYNLLTQTLLADESLGFVHKSIVEESISRVVELGRP